MGLANRLVPKGEARASCDWRGKGDRALPADLSARRPSFSAAPVGPLEEEAIANEMRDGLEVIASGETLSGAKRFAPASADMARSATRFERWRGLAGYEPVETVDITAYDRRALFG